MTTRKPVVRTPAKPKAVKSRSTPASKAAKPTKAKPTKAKPTKAKARKPRRPIPNIVAAARRIADPRKRAAYLEEELDRPDVAKLVSPWLDALWKSPLDGDQVCDHVLAFCRARPTRRELLAHAGRWLERHDRDSEGLELLRLAIVAGASDAETLAVTGRLLVERDDPDGAKLLHLARARPEAQIALAIWTLREPGAAAATRALQIIGPLETARARDVRATALERLGRTREAIEEIADAMDRFDTELDGRYELARWHWNENRYDRALLYGRRMYELYRNLTARQQAKRDKADEMDVHIVRHFRNGGAIAEILPWIQAHCATTMTSDLAWEIHEGLTGFDPIPDPALARRAAETQEAHYRGVDDIDEALSWKVKAALIDAKGGDFAALDACAAGGLEDRAAGWIALAEAYLVLDQYDSAHAAVDRALMLDPEIPDALAVLFEFALRTGDLDGMERSARALLAAKPHWHHGPEDLARLYARLGDAPAAVQHAHRGAHMGPFCPGAWLAWAEASVVAGDLAKARQCMDRARSIYPMGDDDYPIVSAALDGDRAGLDAALAKRFRHLPEVPFPAFVAKLRDAAAATGRPSP